MFSGVLFATDWSRLIIPALPVHSGSPKFVFLNYLKNSFWCIFSKKLVLGKFFEDFCNDILQPPGALSGGLERGTNERPGIWSCDQYANERHGNKFHWEGTHTNVHTYRRTS